MRTRKGGEVLFPFIERSLLTKDLPAISPGHGAVGEALTRYCSEGVKSLDLTICTRGRMSLLFGAILHLWVRISLYWGLLAVG
jgi:hypothetical protein